MKRGGGGSNGKTVPLGNKSGMNYGGTQERLQWLDK